MYRNHLWLFRLSALLIVLPFVLCSCGYKSVATNNQLTSETPTSTNVDAMLPENYFYYTDDFTFSSLDEFKTKIFENGTDALFEYNPDYKELATPHDSKRRDNIRGVLDNCVYEVFYKGKKAEFVNLTGYNVHLGAESRFSDGVGGASYCEYFIKFDDVDPGVALVGFYDYSRISESWDSFEKKTINGNPPMILYSKINIVYDGKETECIINGTRDTKNGEWLNCDGLDLYLKYNDNVVVFIDFAPWDEIDAFVKSSNSVQMQKKIKEELLISPSLPVNKSGFLDNLDDYFTFKKVDLQMAKD